LISPLSGGPATPGAGDDDSVSRIAISYLRIAKRFANRERFGFRVFQR
jgi:hypothetical protein